MNAVRLAFLPLSTLLLSACAASKPVEGVDDTAADSPSALACALPAYCGCPAGSHRNKLTTGGYGPCVPGAPAPGADVVNLSIVASQNKVNVSFSSTSGLKKATVTILQGTTIVATQTDASYVAHHAFEFDGIYVAPCTQYQVDIAIDGVHSETDPFEATRSSPARVTLTSRDARTGVANIQVANPGRALAVDVTPRRLNAATTRFWTDGGATNSIAFPILAPLTDVVVRDSCADPNTGDAEVLNADHATTEFASLEWSPDAPSNADIAGLEGLWEGVAHSPYAWFFTKPDRLIAEPITSDLSAGASAREEQLIPSNTAAPWNHMGDPDFTDGMVLVPMEGSANSGVLFVKASGPNGNKLSVIGSATFNETSAPWLAVNPIDGRIYTSSFNITDDGTNAGRLRSYAFHVSGGVPTIDLASERFYSLFDENGALITSLESIQGGVFSPMGHLYLLQDAGWSATNMTPGIHEFLFDSTVVGKRTFERFHRIAAPTPINMVVNTGKDNCERQELEGIDLGDVSRSTGMSGQVHALLAHYGGDCPYVLAGGAWFKHFSWVAPNASMLEDALFWQ